MLRISLRRCVTFGIFICFVAGMLLGFRFITRDVVSDASRTVDERKENVQSKLAEQHTHNHSELLFTSSQKSLLNKMLEFRAKMHKERILKSKLRSNNTFITTTPRKTTIPFDEDGLNYNVHVFYYMWYGNPQNDGKYFHWNHRLLQNWREKVKRAMVRRHFPPLDIASNYYPELGPYSSSNSEILSIHMEQVKNSGIGCVAVSWYPPQLSDDEGQPSDILIPRLLHVASKFSIKVILHLEPYSGRNHTSFRRDIMYIIREYGDHPALYRRFHRGKWLPMYYIYDSYRISPKHWSEILHEKKRYTLRNTKYDGIYIGLSLDESHLLSLKNAGFDGFYTYFATDGFTHASSWNNWLLYSQFAKTHNMFFIPSVGPGYIDLQVRPWNNENTRDREDGKYYERAFLAAFQAKTQFLTITSFNEWHEGTQIEPAIPQTFDSYHFRLWSARPGFLLEAN